MEDITIVVSFTTIPSRLITRDRDGLIIEKTLSSIINQTLQPSTIYFNIPDWSKKENCTYDKAALKLLTDKYNILHINECKDFGPITKIAPLVSLKLNPQTLIIVIDDDIVYHPDLIKNLVTNTLKYDNSVFSGSGWIVGDWLFWWQYIRNPKYITPVSIIEGIGGYCIRRNMLDDDLLNYPSEIKNEAFYADDNWISGYLAIKGIKRYVCATGQRTTTDLGTINSISNFNLKTLKRVLQVTRYFVNKGLFKEVTSNDYYISVSNYVYIIILLIIIIGVIMLYRCI